MPAVIFGDKPAYRGDLLIFLEVSQQLEWRADQTDLKPIIGCVRGLMARWFCSENRRAAARSRLAVSKNPRPDLRHQRLGTGTSTRRPLKCRFRQRDNKS